MLSFIVWKIKIFKNSALEKQIILTCMQVKTLILYGFKSDYQSVIFITDVILRYLSFIFGRKK